MDVLLGSAHPDIRTTLVECFKDLCDDVGVDMGVSTSVDAPTSQDEPQQPKRPRSDNVPMAPRHFFLHLLLSNQSSLWMASSTSPSELEVWGRSEQYFEFLRHLLSHLSSNSLPPRFTLQFQCFCLLWCNLIHYLLFHIYFYCFTSISILSLLLFLSPSWISSSSTSFFSSFFLLLHFLLVLFYIVLTTLCTCTSTFSSSRLLLSFSLFQILFPCHFFSYFSSENLQQLLSVDVHQILQKEILWLNEVNIPPTPCLAVQTLLAGHLKLCGALISCTGVDKQSYCKTLIPKLLSEFLFPASTVTLDSQGSRQTGIVNVNPKWAKL